MKRILLAEDEVMLLKTLEFKLKNDGYEVVSVQNGQEAIDKINTAIVVLSSVGQEELVVQAFKLGADDYITKPFSPTEFSSRIEKILQS